MKKYQWGIIKYIKIYNMRVPEREEKKKGTERIFEKIMTEI